VTLSPGGNGAAVQMSFWFWSNTMNQGRNMRALRCLVMAAAVITLGVGQVVARDKVDVLTLSNGDRVTGEIKQLNLGELQLKTHLMDTVEIDWIGVTSIASPQLFEVVDSAGAKHFGPISPGKEDATLLVSSEEGDVTLAHDQVVNIAQLERKLLHRWTGHVNLGFNITAANTATNLTLDAATSYRSEKASWSGSLQSTLSDRDDADSTARAVLGTSYEKTIRGNTFWISFAQLENNQELDLDLRATLGAGVGRFLARGVRSELSVIAAPAGNREKYAGQESGDWTAELIVMGRYDLFLFGGHDTRLSTSFGILPSLSSWGRYRIELNSSFSRKITSDLNISISLYDSYDSDPPSDSTSNDWGVTTSLGLTF